MAKIGVLLSGCGVFDGSEIHEAVLTLLALDRAGADIICMAPNVDQAHVVKAHFRHAWEVVGKEPQDNVQFHDVGSQEWKSLWDARRFESDWKP